MKNQFIKGLKNTELRNHIRMEDTSKMELVEVKDLARKYENSLMNTVQKAEFKPTLVSNSKPDTTPKVRFNDIHCNYCKRNGHTESECRTKSRDQSPSVTRQPYEGAQNQANNSTQSSNHQPIGSSNNQFHQANANIIQPKIDKNEVIFSSKHSGIYDTKEILKEINGSCLIDDRLVTFTADTGCTITVVNKAVLENDKGQIEDLMPCNFSCIIADGQPAAIMGQKRVKLVVGKKACYTDVLVSPNLYKECLLGMDVLSTCPLSKDLISGLKDRFSTNQKPESTNFKKFIMFLTLGLLVNPVILNVATSINNVQQAIVNKTVNLVEEIILALEHVTATSMSSLLRTNVLKHIIEIKPGVEPIRQKMRKIPHFYEAEFKDLIHEMLRLEMIKPSKSPWSSPVRLVKKKDGTMRLTVDYRKVNNVTIKDAYPIPNINNMFNHLARGKLFTTLDLHSGYYQVEMDSKTSQYTAFACEYGLFEYRVMPMGLTNATATFQRLMNEVLDGLIGKICFVYLDDIIIFSEDPNDHIKHVKMVADRLRQHKLKIKLTKCKFAQTKIEYLSHVICNGQIYPSPSKTEAIFRTIVPKTVK